MWREFESSPVGRNRRAWFAASVLWEDEYGSMKGQRTALVIIVVSTDSIVSKGSRMQTSDDHTWSLCIVGIKFPRQERNGGHLEEEHGGVKEWLHEGQFVRKRAARGATHNFAVDPARVQVV